MNTKPEQGTRNYYEELDVLFNYIDYQLKKGNFNQAAPAILELYDNILYDSFLKNKKAAIFQDYIDSIAEKENETTDINSLICLIYIYSNRHKQGIYSVPTSNEERKYHNQRKSEVLLLKDSIKRIIKLQPDLDFVYKVKTHNEHYNLDKAFSINPSSMNCYLSVGEKIKKWERTIKDAERHTKEYWNPDTLHVLEYCALNPKDGACSKLEKVIAELTEAIDVITKMMNANGETYFLTGMLGELHFFNNESEVARGYLFKCIQLNPWYYKAWKYIIELLSKNRDYKGIVECMEKITPMTIHSDEDYTASSHIARIGLKAYGEIKEYENGIDFHLSANDSFSNYLERRNNEITFPRSGYHGLNHPTAVLYRNLSNDSFCEERIKVIEMILSKIGYVSSICEDYVLSYLKYKDGISLEKLSISELENICIEDDKKIPIGYFRMYSNNSELKFGKYKGQEIKEIIKSDFKYLIWCAGNVGGFYLNPIILTKLIQKEGEQHIDFIKLNMAKHFLHEGYEREEYWRNEEAKRNSEDNSYGYWMKVANDEYKDFGGIE